MIYYSVIYHKDGCISLKPFETKEEAGAYNKKALEDEKWGPRIDKTKIVKKDEESDWFKISKGYWI